MRIVAASAEHAGDRATMRAALWPDGTVEAHLAEIVEDDGVAFVALNEASAAVGFVEAALRHDYVNGCDTSPVAFVEGIYVDPAHRRAGVAGALVAAVEQWALGLGCSELAADADIDNADSQATAAALGLIETERVVFFRKPIG